MKAIAVVLIALIAAAAADCKFKPKKRDCAWNLDIIQTDNETSWLRTRYYVNGQFWATYTEDYGGNVLTHRIYRPDIKYKDILGKEHDTSLFTSSGGSCDQTVGVPLDKAWNFYEYLFGKEITFADCKKDVEWEGKKKLTRYETLGKTLYVYANEDDEPVGLESPLLLKTYYKLDWGSSAPMSKFSFSKWSVYKCEEEKIFENGDDDYVLCAATSVKAIVSVVVAAVATALISLF